MDTAEFVQRHPRLFHLAHGDAWPSLQEHGLLRVESLLKRSGLPEAEKQEWLTRHRPTAVAVPVPGFASVTLRDQAPLSLIKLSACLTGGMTASAWLALLNSMVFLFPNEATLATLYEKYRSHRVTVLELDSRSLVADYGSLIRLASINTGATVYVAAKRGADTSGGSPSSNRGGMSRRWPFATTSRTSTRTSPGPNAGTRMAVENCCSNGASQARRLR